MATRSRPAPRPLSEHLRAEPQAFELLQALLVLEREQPRATSLGCGTSPAAEAVRLRGPLTPLFAASQVESLLSDEDGKTQLTTPVFGLGGPDGPLPYAYQEWLQQRARLKDHAPAAFLDLFQHRLLSLLYRVLRKHRIALGFGVPNASPVQAQLRAFTGLLPKTLQERQALSDSAILSRSALFIGGRRSLAGFSTLVRQHFAQPVQASAYAGAWRSIPAASRSRLGRGGRNLKLGHDAVAGSRVWDEHAGISLTLGPLEPHQASGLLPGGEAHSQLASLASFYFGPDLDCTLRLLVKGAAPLSLNRQDAPRLSWNTGLQVQASGATHLIETRLQPTAQA
ncbi:type VI secretion system protein ImpH [Pseudomonas sp. TE3786]